MTITTTWYDGTPLIHLKFSCGCTVFFNSIDTNGLEDMCQDHANGVARARKEALKKERGEKS